MKIAIAQLKASPDKNINLTKAKDYIREAKTRGADLIVFPEGYMAYVPQSSKEGAAGIAEPLDGPFVTKLAEEAKSNQLHIVCGVYELKSDEDYRAYNTAVIIGSDGELISSYRKTHLFDAFERKESNKVVPSTNSFKVINTSMGKIGIMICYEIRFPEIARILALQGADMIITPTAWAAGLMKEHHWRTLLTSRAIENTIYVVGAGQVGNNNSGNSMVIDPMGIAVASAGEEESLIIAKIDLERIRRVREKLPSMSHRKPDLYKALNVSHHY